ncbi:MAG: 16S rRNA (uracil(1498)-N(3))-methyltransferase [Fibrobacteres bacterium]|nr:16S rRNA (uracil(1498)-N(3))-methyltransferase [Fibrobacterota bacterium]
MLFNENYFFIHDLSICELDSEESHHAIKVLRLSITDTILITDGQGNLAECMITDTHKGIIKFEIQKQIEPDTVQPIFTLALSITKKNSFETALEMCGQLPIKTILPFSSTHSCRQTEFLENGRRRFEEKLKTALKQSKKRWQTALTETADFNTVINSASNYDSAALYEKLNKGQDTCNPEQIRKAASILVIIGPEGGFSENEIDMAKREHIPVYSLGDTRLRAETAAFASIIQLSALRIST